MLPTTIVRVRASLLAASLVLGAGATAAAAPARAAGRPAPRAESPATFRVGVDVESIDPAYPVYLGGYGGGPSGGTLERHVNPLTGRPEELTVRAMSIEASGHVVELASIDSQGWFAGYEEGPYGISDVRAAAASFIAAHGAPATTPADIIVSSLHEHAVPTLYGIYGPPAHQVPYLRAVAAATTRALEKAFANATSATITWGATDAPWLGGGDIAEGNEFEGWRRDGSLVALWAKDPAGRTIATFVSEPAYANIVFGPADLVGAQAKRTLISGDFPGYAEAMIEQRLGGVAILATGSLANQASPLQADVAPSPDLPPAGGLAQTRAFDDIIQMANTVAHETFTALASARPITESIVGGAEQAVVSPITDPAVSGLAVDNNIEGGTVFGPSGYWGTDRPFTPPYGYGGALTTWVTAVRVGGVILLSEPGEFFGSIRETWAKSIGADGVFVLGAAQDFLGYEYPLYVVPFTALGGDEFVFGPSATLGDQVMSAGQHDASQLGLRVDGAANAELTALDHQYGRVLDAGVWLLPSAVAGDIDPRTGAFDTVLLGAGSPARVTMTCDNPALLVGPPGCSAGDPATGPFRWSFGDGTTAVTPAQGRARAQFSPFVHHAYTHPGRYTVSVAVTSGGSTDTMSLPIDVHAPLHVAVSRTHGRAVARVTGGDGHILQVRWSGAGPSDVFAPSVPAPGGSLRVTVLDGTGATATATG